jgi:hypothetical protein
MPKSLYETLAQQRGDSPEWKDCISRTVEKLLLEQTSSKRPGMLLGKIQSGKTRAFLGVIALAFDKGYDVAIVLTKGTISLARQTLIRIKDDFETFCNDTCDDLQVYDIMSLPRLTPYELGKKLIFVVKKEDDNMRRLLKAFAQDYPQLQERKVLIVDDEADLASVSFRRDKGGVKVGVVSTQIDKLRALVKSFAFLQVTATPHSLYLQPEEDVAKRCGTALFQPKRPMFTEILPIHPDYVGGEYYFEESNNEASPAFHLYKPVPLPEREALKQEDERRFKLDDVLTSKNTEVLCQAIVDFLMGACIRRIQQAGCGEPPLKYSFLFHTEPTRKSHDWQKRVVTAIHDALVAACNSGDSVLPTMLRQAYENLQPSVLKAGLEMPSYTACETAVREALAKGWLMITTVNSESEVDALLDDKGQLKLRTPMNIFIGGQILDRGITIGGLIGFYYGRNPKKFQQDTILQHSRMYGARPKDDLGVTRFYAPLNIYQIMRRIHDFDSALREAFVTGVHDRGVYFVLRDAAQNLSPCSPNKVMFSSMTSVRPGGRLVPIHFQTVAKTSGRKALDELDGRIRAIFGGQMKGGTVISLKDAVEMLALAFTNLVFEEEAILDGKPFLALLEHLSKTATDPVNRGKVYLLAASDRNLTRLRDNGRFSDAPDTKQQTDEARENATGVPALMMFRQNGEADGWRGLPFWWPVIVVPSDAVTCVFAAQSADEKIVNSVPDPEVAADPAAAEVAPGDAFAFPPSTKSEKAAAASVCSPSAPTSPTPDVPGRSVPPMLESTEAFLPLQRPVRPTLLFEDDWPTPPPAPPSARRPLQFLDVDEEVL